MTLDQLANAFSGMSRSGAAQAVSRGCRLCLVVFVVLVGVLTSSGVAARDRQKSESPLGLWQTQGGGVIEIFWCGDVLCGSIVGIPRAPGAPIPKDSAGRSECGLTIMTQVSERQDGSWSGHITDPRDGSQYHVKLRVDDRGSLHLRGYILLPLLGQTQIWQRYAGRVGPDCTIA
jgi:uncharacterized protein (DUF2147 family)